MEQQRDRQMQDQTSWRQRSHQPNKKMGQLCQFQRGLVLVTGQLQAPFPPTYSTSLNPDWKLKNVVIKTIFII
jgi:hypothetical protein